MSDNSQINLDDETLSHITQLFDNFLSGLGSQITSKIKELEDSVESIEKQIATLILGYGEQAIFLEALVAQLSFSTDEERKAFTENVSQGRKEMLKVMQDASKGTMATQYPETASALADMAEQQLSDTNI
jgi:hypothetical protein